MKKLYKFLAVALMAVMAMGSQTVSAQSLSPSTKWHWDKGTIVIDSPERPAGQEHVLGLKADPIQTVRIGFVGGTARQCGRAHRQRQGRQRGRGTAPCNVHQFAPPLLMGDQPLASRSIRNISY
jgi:hypothetical protein